jgi:lipooligosaccharide transport system permease protein
MPVAAQWVVSVLPLYHAVEMLRQLTIGSVDASILLHIGYLVALGAVTFAIAMRRLERALIK